jgi:hypothetical protein
MRTLIKWLSMAACMLQQRGCLQVCFGLTDDGVDACFGHGQKNSAAATAGAHTDGAQQSAVPLAPVRVVLDYLQHVRAHGLQDWRWQELQASLLAEELCAFTTCGTQLWLHLPGRTPSSKPASRLCASAPGMHCKSSSKHSA